MWGRRTEVRGMWVRGIRLSRILAVGQASRRSLTLLASGSPDWRSSAANVRFLVRQESEAGDRRDARPTLPPGLRQRFPLHTCGYTERCSRTSTPSRKGAKTPSWDCKRQRKAPTHWHTPVSESPFVGFLVLVLCAFAPLRLCVKKSSAWIRLRALPLFP